ncbi:MAG TPA: adenylosuccinate synthase [Bacteroidetes bacterium]|nr:adenylosuccinate synthase [Bacteroidota bacterium]
MPVVAVIGAQWGDEGKGKIVDLLSSKADVVARSQGGANAGHTIERGEEKIILHLLPSGILTPGILCLIGPGVVLDPEAFIKELDHVKTLGVSLQGRLTLDFRTHLVLPTHKLIEAHQEKDRGEDMIGTTCRGIGPTYADKASRQGVRVGDLLQKSRRLKVCGDLFDHHAALLKCFYKQVEPDRKVFLEMTERWAEALAPFAGDAVEQLHQALDTNRNVLLEGAQGTLLDLDLGTYPYVTSSHPTIGGPVLGLGVPPRKIDFVLGVLKAYCTRVGCGPFPTEMDEVTAEEIRKRGAEFGSTTGRPRRCGWLDLIAARQAARWNGIDGWAVTKLDVLDGQKPLKACIGYQIKGKVITSVPATHQGWEQVEPVYGELKGWKDSYSKRSMEDLPQGAIEYLETIEKFTHIPVYMISLGAGQEATILPRGEIIK